MRPLVIVRLVRRGIALGGFVVALSSLLPAPSLAQDPAARTADAPVPGAVRVWEGTLTLPTYDEGPPDPNPPFDNLLPPGRPNYPYTIRDALTDVRRPRAWRALFLENEYLRCSVLPDLGGHLYSCTDKVNGAELFYDNSSIKFSNIAYRGSWAAFGIEFNFPVSHNWMTTSPVDFATRQETDGGASIVVGSIDRPYGMQWTVRLTLRPGAGVLEQHTTLYNRSDVRRRFYWWTNAAVRAFDDTQILYPMKYTASHGFADVDTWPVDARGTDNSVLKNHVHGPVSRFAHGSREGFMGVWHPRTNAGVAHYAAPDELPAKKIWSWGVNADAMDWRRQLSDDSSAYVEIQAGLFRDQETYGFLQPQDQVSFTEYWMPLRELGGLTRMNAEGALHLTRHTIAGDSVELRLAVQLTRTHPTATVRLEGAGARAALHQGALTPGTVLHLSARLPAAAPPATIVVSAGDTILLAHTEGRFDFLPDSLIRVGRQPAVDWPPAAARMDGDWLTYGEDREVNGDLLGAMAAYRRGLALNPRHRELLRAAARLAVTLGHTREGEELATRALAVQPADHEMAYYRGLARLTLSDTTRARLDLELARQYGPLRQAALLALVRTNAGMSATQAELEHQARTLSAADPTRLREAFAIAALRERSSPAPPRRSDETPGNVARILSRDPTSAVGRWMRFATSGALDSAFDRHMAGDAERVLDVADALVDGGLLRGTASAEQVLTTAWPDDAGVVREAGVPHPNRHALVHYYRAWVADAPDQLAAAGALPLDYVFPHRPRARTVLEWALARRPDDQSARYLLGMMAMQRGDVAQAIAMWDSVRAARPTGVPALYRNLGAALLLTGDTARAAEAFDAGTRAEPGNPGVWVGADSLLALAGRPAGERAAQLDRFPSRTTMPTALVYLHARLLAAAGRFDDAERLFAARFLSRVEGGTNPRAVWLEVRLARGEWLAAQGDCRAASRLVDRLARPVTGLAFTRDGMAEQLRAPALARRARAITGRCAGTTRE